jgi:glycosyltransferase involved in cell wall biosynthesis
MKIFPYLHSGRPLIVTDLPTHNQILDQTVAMLCPPDPHGLARGITRLARDPDLRRRLGAAGRRFVEQNHTFEAHQTRVNRLYEHVERACAVRAG